MFEKVFKLKENKTTVRVELLAGFTTFLAMAYILVINPQILGTVINTPGNPEAYLGQLVFVTALSGAFGSILMGILGNLPVALAPGMGMNAFFAFTVAAPVAMGGMGFTWQQALATVFLSGIIFILITATGLREKVIRAIPNSLKAAVGVGIGFFIAFIGLQKSGIIVPNEGTFVGIGDLTNPKVLLSIFGILIVFFLMSRKVKASVFFGIVISTVVGLIITYTAGAANGFWDLGVMLPANGIFSWTPPVDLFGQCFGAIPSLFTAEHITGTLIVIITVLFVDFFDATGTLLSVTRRAGLIEKDGQPRNVGKALFADSIATTAGAVMGTSSVTTYVESLTGVEVGGKTGLTSVFTGVFFLIAVIFAPIFAIVTPEITAPALIAVGCLMAQSLGEIDFKDKETAFAAFITIIMMLLTFSIAKGIAFGFIVYGFLMLASGRAKEVPVLIYVLDVLFILILALS